MQGKVTIYIQYSNKGEDEDKPPAPPVRKEGESERSQLGTFVVSLGKFLNLIPISLLMTDMLLLSLTKTLKSVWDTKL